MIKAITTTLNGNVKQRYYVMNDDVIHTECKCGEELYFDTEVDCDHENWYCPKCDVNYLVPIETYRYFKLKEQQ